MYLLGISIYSLLKGYLEGVKQLGALHPKGTTIFHIGWRCIPKHLMYGLFAYIWGIVFGVNVSKYTVFLSVWDRQCFSAWK